MRILVTGATGFLGRSTVRALVAAGHDVRALVRDAARAREAFGSVRVDIVVGDLGDTASVAAALTGCDALVHAAAEYRYDRAGEAAMDANASLTESALGAALRLHVRVVDVSSLVVFSLDVDHLVETAPLTTPADPAWRDPYLRSKVLAEQVARRLEGEGLDRVTVHPGLIVGPDDAGPGTSGQLLVRLLRGGAQADARTTLVDVRDVAAAIVAALRGARGAHVLLAADVITQREICRRMDALTGRHPWRVFIGPRVLRAIARLNDVFRGRLADVPPAGSLDYVLRNARAVDTSRATRDLGIAFRPLDDTLVDTIRWWAAHGVIDPKLAGRLAPG